MEELTGWEEHVRDEAYECGEIAALRREAEDEARREAAMHEQEEEEYVRARGFACASLLPSCSKGLPVDECAPDNLPF